MRKRLPIGLVLLLGLVTISILAVLGLYAQAGKTEQSQVSTSQQSTSAHSQTSQVASQTDSSVSELSSTSTDSTDPSQAEPTSSSSSAEQEGYPDLSQYQQLAVYVSTAKQEMTIRSGEQVLFKTSVSTGAPESPTPTGQFVIEAERGDFFYNASSGEGAYYWVSFKDHGIYLFHSLPTDQAGNEIPEEAARLGKPASHGCVRMPRATAKWFYENIPEGIPVIIE